MDIKYLISLLALTPLVLCSWTKWSKWSSCSWPCGGGVSNRTRSCTSEISCNGGDGIQYRVCNLRMCKDGMLDSRQEQCSSFNDQQYQAQLYEWTPGTPSFQERCQLTCRAIGHDISVVLAPRVMDGAKCTPNSKSVCIGGHCMKVGCDNIVGSNLRRDSCGICGGDGSTCLQIIDNELGQGAVERDQILPFHDDSVEVDIDERQDIVVMPSSNLPTNSHATNLDNNRNQDHREIETLAAYATQTRDNYDYQNDGTEDIMSIFDIPEHIWQETSFSECSVTCGEGMQRTSIICKNIRTRQTVADSFCGRARKPPHKEKMCYTENDCGSRARWTTGNWQDCDVSCGGGFRERPVYCLSDYSTRVDPMHCEGDIPEARERCNEISCPTWHPGQWTECSVSCGAGKQFREVACKRHNSLNCDEDEMPAKVQICHTGVICLPSYGTKLLPEHENRIIVDNKPVSYRPVKPDFEHNRVDNFNNYGELQDHPSIEWNGYRGNYDSRYGAVDYDYRDYTGVDFEYNGNDLVDKFGIGTDYDYRGNEILASYGNSLYEYTDGSGEETSDWYRPDEPSFVPSSWSDCSVTCGHGERTRSVRCKLNALEILPESRCTGPKPLEKDGCIMANCPVLIAEQARETYAWEFAGYSACSTTCGGGFRKPIFYCIRPDETSHIQVDENYCSSLQKPTGVHFKQSCNEFPCPASLSRRYPRWKTYEYGECSHQCGGGQAHRQVDCIIEVGAGGQFQRVPDSTCTATGQPIPSRTRLCNQISCPPYWAEGPWSECSATCGSSQKQRQVLCKRIVPPSRILEVMADEFCQGDKPVTSMPCPELEACQNRKPQVRGDPSRYVQLQARRNLRLAAGGTASVLPRTHLRIRCPIRNFPKGELVWKKEDIQIPRKGRVKKTGRGMLIIKNAQWTDAGIYTCHAGDKSVPFTLRLHSQNEATAKYIAREQARNQNFLRQFRQQKNQDNNRKEECTEPYLESYFEYGEVPFRYVESEWGPCSISCGGAGLQSRKVTCELNFEQYYLEVDDDFCENHAGLDKPLTTKDCGFDHCPHWIEGSYGECSDEYCLEPGTGAEVRKLICIASNGTEIPGSACDQVNKPMDKKPCPKDTCIPEWKHSDWTPCSRTCGGRGHQTRSLVCAWVPNERPAGRHCDGIRPPEVIRECETEPCLLQTVCRDVGTHCSFIAMMDYCHYPDYRSKCCVTCSALRYRYRH